jgi:predicted lipoprotein with Yx(FWY)xxD motif
VRLLGTIALVLVLLPAAAAAAGEPVVKAAYNAKLKTTILVDGRGVTLYMFTEDVRNAAPKCVDDRVAGCQKVWPGLFATSGASAGKGVKASLLGTTSRSDGKLQVTYGGYPLYYFAGDKTQYGGHPRDKKPGDVNGQGDYDVWYVVSPAGKPVKKK